MGVLGLGLACGFVLIEFLTSQRTWVLSGTVLVKPQCCARCLQTPPCRSSLPCGFGEDGEKLPGMP